MVAALNCAGYVDRSRAPPGRTERNSTSGILWGGEESLTAPSPSLRSPRGPLAQRNFLMLFGARAVSSLGDGISLVALTFAMLDLAGPGGLALVLLAREIPTVAMLLIGGVWADRMSRRKLMIGANLAMFAAQAASGALVLADSAAVWNIALLQVVYGLGNALFLPASLSVVPQTVTSEHLQKANALLSLSRNSLGVIGPMAGALLVATVGEGWGMAADAGTFLLASLAFTLMRITEPEREESESVLKELQGGWKEFTSRTWVWTIVSSFGLFQLAVFPVFMVLGARIAKEDLGGAGAWGGLLAATSAGAILGALVATKLKPKLPLVFGQFLILPVGLFFALFAVGAPLLVLQAVAVFAWACSELGDTLWYTALHENVPEEALGRISSFDFFGSQLFKPIGFALVGPVGAAVGANTVMLGSAGLLVLVTVAILFVPGVWQIRSAEAATEAEATPEAAAVDSK
ncbi:MFS transporter [Streptomyces sp. XD-27]|nr:MFS transporter [Streptomyces sp. XD-27]WKX73986.1 MFS transporter [Streptomyces sp. XD-27]